MKDDNQASYALGFDDLRALGPGAVAYKVDSGRRGPHPAPAHAPAVPTAVALGALAEGMADGILAVDGAGVVVAHNRRFNDLWGIETELPVGCTVGAMAPVLAAQLGSADGFATAWRAANAPGPDRNEVFRLRNGRVLEGRLASGGVAQPVLRVWSFRDITEREQTMARTALLADVGRLLISLDLDATLEAVARSALPLLGDLCAVDRIADGRMDRALEVRTESSVWLEPPETFMSCEAPEVRSEAARSRLTVPIVLRGIRCGTLSLVARTPAAYGAREKALAEELAARLALAMEAGDAYRRTREELAERERMVSVAAHELRSPLASLRIAVEALRRKEHEGPRQARLLDVIDRDERRLTRMIGELLDLGRIRSGQLDLQLDSVDLSELVHEVVGRMSGEIARSGSRVVVAAEGPVIGRWDRSRLEQVVTNLLGNATKYGAGRPIEVRVGTEVAEGRGGGGAAGRPHARLAVIDQGSGIGPEVQGRIFEPFARAPGLRETSGLGLGLYIVQTIVHRMGGDVRVDSAPERGATFTVNLPLAEHA